MGILKAVLTITGLAALVFAAIPPFYGIFNMGVAALAALSLLCFLQTFLLCERRRKQEAWEIFSGRGRLSRLLRRLLGVALSLFLVVELALSAIMVMAATINTPTYSDSVTALVLGCDITGEAPSKMLKNRLEKALIYLNEVPDAKVVVTGGKGANRLYSESAVEAKWLTEKGIAPERIILEDRSTDTYENIQYAVELLTQNGLPPQAVLFTDGFHQLRCQLYARSFGLQATGVASNTPWGLLPAYWLREQMALAKAVMVVARQANEILALPKM